MPCAAVVTGFVRGQDDVRQLDDDLQLVAPKVNGHKLWERGERLRDWRQLGLLAQHGKEEQASGEAGQGDMQDDG